MRNPTPRGFVFPRVHPPMALSMPGVRRILPPTVLGVLAHAAPHPGAQREEAAAAPVPAGEQGGSVRAGCGAPSPGASHPDGRLVDKNGGSALASALEHGFADGG